MSRSLLPKTASGCPLAAEGRTARRALSSKLCSHADLTLLGPNVRHERRRKGREAAFETSARWRG